MTTRKARNPSNPTSLPHRSTSKSLHPHKPQHSHHTSHPSDSSPPPSPPPTRTNAQLNLLVLRRHYPSTAAILSLAPYAVLYAFNPASSAWEKRGIEGTLFVCALDPSASSNEKAGPSRYAVTILNRRGLENFWLELTGGEEVEVTEEYVILQGGEGKRGEVYGLWIFEEGAGSTKGIREATARLIKECAEAAGGVADDTNDADGCANTEVTSNEPEEEPLGTRYTQLAEEFDRAKDELEELQRRRNQPHPFQPHPRHFAPPPQPPPSYQPPAQDSPYPFQPHPRHFQPTPTAHPPSQYHPPPHPPLQTPQQPPTTAPPPPFAPSGDTQFFLSNPRPQPQPDVLAQLFAKAKGERRGVVG